MRVAGVLLGLVLAGVIAAAQETATPVPTPAPTPALTPVPAAEIPERAADTRTLLRTAASQTRIDDELEQLEREFTAERQRLEDLLAETQSRMSVEGPASALEETEKSWARLQADFDRWLVNLKEHVTRLEGALEEVEAERELWQLTRQAAGEQELPPAVRHEIDDTVEAIEDAAARLRSVRDRALVLQSRIAKARATADDMLAGQREEIDRRRRSLWRLDSPPLWRAGGERGDGSPAAQLRAAWEKNTAELRAYVADRKGSLIRHIGLLVVVVLVLRGLRGKAHLWAQQDPSLGRAVRILERPLAAAIVVTIFLRDVLYPEAPAAWLNLLSVVLLLALLRVFPLLVRPAMKPLALYLMVLFLLRGAAGLTVDGTVIDRTLLLVMSATGVWAAWWVHRQLVREPPSIPRGWFQVAVLGAQLAMVLFAVAAVADLLGSVGLATVLVAETLFAVYTAVLFWIGAVVLHSVVRVGLLTETARRFGVVRLHAEEVRRALFRLIDLAAVLGWCLSMLVEVKILAPAETALRRTLGAELSLGAVSINVGDILLFAIVVWLSFKLSRLIQTTLDADIYPRMELPRGVPGAINRLTHYALIVVGVMFAATVAGLDFTRLTFVIGALGVGIGFGLQNIVNNFVSGLILLFERPIRLGDKVELANLSGTVERIGIRASVVRTWQGAEVIVPNANLISSEVINWTLSDDRRRMEMPVGVAYGTDPEVVLRLLLDVARSHDEVLKDPEPVALFTGFGDSSLDFELRAWTTGDIVVIPSQLRVGINRALAEAGIEIPFPQRDLHLRSVASAAADRFKAGDG